MIRKIIPIMAFVFLVQAVFAQITDQGSLRVSLVNQEPDPVNPGEYVDIRFKLENIGDEDLMDVQIQLVTTEYFKLDAEKPATIDVGSLEGFQAGDLAKIVKYRVKVDEGAVEGQNEIEVKVKTSSTDWETYKFNIDVRTTDAIIALESVKTTPSPITPGGEAKVNLVIHNLADSNLKDVVVALDLALLTEGVQTLDTLPFAPLESGTVKNIKQMKPGEMRDIEFIIKAYPTAESKVYKIPVAISYKDELDTEYDSEDIISLIVNSEPDLSVILSDTDITENGMKGEVSIKFINKGLADIKFVDVILEHSDDYEILSPGEVYIGNIESDDYENADYELYVEDGNRSEILLPVKYSYMDSNNNIYRKDTVIRVKLYDPERAVEIGLKKPSRNYTSVIALIAVVFLFFMIYRIYKKRRK